MAGVVVTAIVVFAAVTAQGVATNGTLAPGPSASPGASATSAPDPKNQPPPPGYTTRPGPPHWPAATLGQVEANLINDAFVRGQLAELTSPGANFYNPKLTLPPLLGTPVYVRAIVSGHPNIWLVPVLANASVIGVIGVEVYADGTGAAGYYSGWAGGFPHALSSAQALVAASTPTDAGVSAELVAATVSPMEGGPATPFYPMYRVVRASGAVVYVFQAGNVELASDVHPY